jgi:PEP-CTERM motif
MRGGGKHSLLLAGATLAILAPFQAAQAVIIDFESLEQNNDLVNDVGFSYTEDGFTLDDLSLEFPFAVFGTQETRFPGSTALFNNTIDGITRLTQNSGGLFDINSIQLTSLNGDTSVTVNFTGTKADSSTVTQSFTTDAILSTLETFTFNSSFTDLVSVEWLQIEDFHQFDNINVTPSNGETVPEPSAMLGLLSLGLLGIGSKLKQKR